MHLWLKEKLFEKVLHDLNELASREACLKQFVQEREKTCVSQRDRKKNLVSIIAIENPNNDICCEFDEKITPITT